MRRSLIRGSRSLALGLGGKPLGPGEVIAASVLCIAFAPISIGDLAT
jgi:hypothetical protein